LVALIPGTFELDGVGLTELCEATLKACPRVVPGGEPIMFSVGFLFAYYSGILVHFAVCALVLLMSIACAPFHQLPRPPWPQQFLAMVLN